MVANVVSNVLYIIQYTLIDIHEKIKEKEITQLVNNFRFLSTLIVCLNIYLILFVCVQIAKNKNLSKFDQNIQCNLSFTSIRTFIATHILYVCLCVYVFFYRNKI